jgi:beta-carotene 3-hydroxylase
VSGVPVEDCLVWDSRFLAPVPETTLDDEVSAAAARRVAEMKARKRSERRTYLVAAVMSRLGVTSMAVAAVYYRFSWQMEVTFY